MIHSVKDLSPNQKISIRAIPLPPAPDWLRDIQHDAREKGVSDLTVEDINAEIAAARRQRSAASD